MNGSPLIAVIAAALPLGCGADGHPTSRPVAPSARISSSIADGAQLDTPIRWAARVTGVAPRRVVSVRFFVDGRVRHVAWTRPYVFALPSTLPVGSHTFGVDARLADRTRVTAASSATISRRSTR